MPKKSRKRTPKPAPATVTIVIPAFNEAANLALLIDRIGTALADARVFWDAVVVDDGSTDETAAVLHDLRSSRSYIGFVRLSRNFGHQMAILAGMDVARGQAVIVMDADLQQPPEILPELIRRWQSGAKIVHTVRKTERAWWSAKSLTSRAFYAVIRRLTSVPIVPNAAEFFLADRQVVDHLIRCRERSRFNRGLLGWVGFRRDFVEYEAAARHSGRAKWTMRKMAQLALDAIFSFSIAPLRILGAMGLASACLTFLYGAYVLLKALFLGGVVRGWPSTVLLIGWFGSIQMLTLWAIGEYVARIYLDVGGRPPYVVEEANLSAQPAAPDDRSSADGAASDRPPVDHCEE
jgi:glycosyltransferase involved in cell wall biosynthesis